MKSTIVKTAMLAAIASLAMTGQTWAHHMSYDVNPNYDFVDGQISENHNEVIENLLEDEDTMFNTLRGAGIDSAMMAMGTGSNEMTVTNQGSVPTTAPGISSASQMRTSTGNR